MIITSREKRGLSPVIATVLLIMITISAAAILTPVILNFVKKNTEKTECVPYTDYFKFEESVGGKRYNCYIDGLYGFTIRAVPDENFEGQTEGKLGQNIAGFNIVFIEERESVVINITRGEASDCNIESIRMLNLSVDSCNQQNKIVIPDFGGIKTYVYNSGPNKNYEFVEVYPILKSGRTCAGGDRIKLIECESDVALEA